MIVLDTDLSAALMQPDLNSRVWIWLGLQMESELHTTSITVSEMLHGALLLPAGARRDRMLAALAGCFGEGFGGRVLPFDAAAAVEYAGIIVWRRSIEWPIRSRDAQIAAIARAHGATLATRYVADYGECGIRVINPWELM
ncbi:type II toxin-antitoxin system VapC family toxin [Ferrovibrio sp.]|uniref:type II toxin-antitoxin system VapC family toxin n=1 Tax=Ferrovibrio sp. TaxID=1917215 RepID=UPI00262A2499|nr:type II toxin-antitoxin system VapC family toxin [Ferrovibrio sp.]